MLNPLTSSEPMPVFFLPHGGGPMPLLGEPSHQALVEFLQKIPAQLGNPKAILVISAHWETAQPVLMAAANPSMLYDYSGFPEQSYHLQYPAPGDPALAQQIQQMLQSAGMPALLDQQRGFDHGLFVPLMLLYPDARIPCLQISLLRSMDPAQHIQMGKALAALRSQGVLIIGSGMSFHNMQAFYHTERSPEGKMADAFDVWLTATCCDDSLTCDDRQIRLEQWATAPGARYCHPREEHLLPLHVCFGAAMHSNQPAQAVFHDKVLGKKVVALLWR